MDISLLHLADAGFSGGLLGAVFGSAALALGCASGRRGLTVGITAALGVGAFFLMSLAPWSRAWRAGAGCHPFIPIRGPAPKNGLSWVHAAVQTDAAALFIALSVSLFDRRDIAV